MYFMRYTVHENRRYHSHWNALFPFNSTWFTLLFVEFTITKWFRIQVALHVCSWCFIYFNRRYCTSRLSWISSSFENKHSSKIKRSLCDLYFCLFNPDKSNVMLPQILFFLTLYSLKVLHLSLWGICLFLNTDSEDKIEDQSVCITDIYTREITASIHHIHADSFALLFSLRLVQG